MATDRDAYWEISSKESLTVDRDPVLLKIERDSAKAVKPSAEIQAKMAQIRGLRIH